MQILIIANKYNNFYPALKPSIHRDYAQMAVCFHVELSAVSILIEFTPAARLNSTRAHIKYMIYRRAHAKQPTYNLSINTLTIIQEPRLHLQQSLVLIHIRSSLFGFSGKSKRQTQPSSS